MAKLYLRFEGKELKEVTVTQSAVITIGRLPDNLLQIDNLAVSGHHAKIYWDGEHYTLEDNGSLNGTYVNNQRVTKHKLKNGDTVLVGKHSVEFKDEWHDDQRERQGRHGVDQVEGLAVQIAAGSRCDGEQAREQVLHHPAGQACQCQSERRRRLARPACARRRRHHRSGRRKNELRLARIESVWVAQPPELCRKARRERAFLFVC